MGYQSIANSAGNIITQGARKYIAPICRVGTAKELGLNAKKISKMLSTDVFEPSVKINLTRELQSTVYAPDKIREVFAKYPELSRRVGTLPPELAKKLGNGEGLTQFDEVLTNFAKNFTAKNGEIAEEELTTLAENLSKILGEEVTITPIGKGKIGFGYKISTKEKDMFFKCFFPSSSKPYIEQAGHGNYPEIASALYSKKSAPGEFIKFYMGRFGEKSDGYMLTEFIEGKPAYTEHKFRFRDLIRKFIPNDPNPANKIKGKFIDFGMCDPTEYDKMSPLSYKILKKIMIALDEGSAKNLENVISKYQGKAEYKEALAKVEDIISRKFVSETEQFTSRKELFTMLGLDYKPQFEKIISKIGKGIPRSKIEELAQCYGISVSEIEAAQKSYFDSIKSNFSNNAFKK